MISGSVSKLGGDDRAQVDVLIASIGCERRSSALLRSESVYAPEIIGLRFLGPDLFDLDNNRTLFDQAGSLSVDDYLYYFRHNFPVRMQALRGQLGRPIHIGIDVSSMNRSMIATVLSVVFALDQDIERCSIFYVPAQFAAPDLNFPRIESVGPVIPALSGFHSDPSLPFGLIIGVGFEYGLGVGLINQVEPRMTICCRAVGPDPRFGEAVENANLGFDFGVDFVMADYNLMDGQGTFRTIENFCYSLRKRFRLVIAPMGPKLFAAFSVLAAIRYFGQVAVWRIVSLGVPKQAIESADLITVSTEIGALASPKTAAQMRKMLLGDFA